MSAHVVYEISRHGKGGDPSTLLERTQLLSVDGVLRLRDSGGSETPCAGVDIAAAISATPSLREIRTGEEARISCAPEIAATLPFVLHPVLGDGEYTECYAEVNGSAWAAYPTIDDDYVMLPGWDAADEPEMSPCWAQLTVEEGEWNPLVGRTSIGLATPGVVVEYANYDHGGIGGASAVVIRKFDDFATVFVDWLVNGEVLEQLWGGDTSPCSPTVELFAEAAAAADKKSGWNTEMNAAPQDELDDEDEDSEDEDDDEDSEDEGASNWASAFLKLHLSEELIEQVRVGISAQT